MLRNSGKGSAAAEHGDQLQQKRRSDISGKDQDSRKSRSEISGKDQDSKKMYMHEVESLAAIYFQCAISDRGA